MYVPTMLSLARRAASLTVLLALAGCTDQGKVAEAHAQTWVASVAKRAAGDVADLEVGFPLGAKQLAPLFAEGNPGGDMDGVRKGLKKIRSEIPELTRSASTFFALVDAKGIAVRNDLDQDVMAGQDVWKLFPGLRKTTEAPFATASGLFAGARSAGEPDRDWVAGVPITDAHGAYAGMLIGGWTMKRFAFHLQESMRNDLLREPNADPGKVPIVYVSAFDASGVYSAPTTPSVNHKAMIDLAPLTKTANGVAHGVQSITDRDFGWAATRVPTAGQDTGVIVLWSEI